MRIGKHLAQSTSQLPKAWHLFGTCSNPLVTSHVYSIELTKRVEDGQTTSPTASAAACPAASALPTGERRTIVDRSSGMRRVRRRSGGGRNPRAEHRRGGLAPRQHHLGASLSSGGHGTGRRCARGLDGGLRQWFILLLVPLRAAARGRDRSRRNLLRVAQRRQCGDSALTTTTRCQLRLHRARGGVGRTSGRSHAGHSGCRSRQRREKQLLPHRPVDPQSQRQFVLDRGGPGAKRRQRRGEHPLHSPPQPGHGFRRRGELTLRTGTDHRHVADPPPVVLIRSTDLLAHLQQLPGTAPSANTSRPGLARGGRTRSVVRVGLSRHLLHLAGPPDFRSNIGFAEVFGIDAELEIRFFDATGADVGGGELIVPASSHLQINDVHDHFDLPSNGDLSAVVTVDSFGRVFSYASVLDNLSSDPIYVPGVAADSANSDLVIPAAAATDGAFGTSWRTDLRVLSMWGGASVMVSFIPTDGSEVLSRSFDFEGTGMLGIDDVVSELGGSGSGALLLQATHDMVATVSHLQHRRRRHFRPVRPGLTSHVAPQLRIGCRHPPFRGLSEQRGHGMAQRLSSPIRHGGAPGRPPRPSAGQRPLAYRRAPAHPDQ